MHLPSFATVLSDSVSSRPSPPIETRIDSSSSEHRDVSSLSTLSRPPSATLLRHHQLHQLHQHPHQHHPYHQQQLSEQHQRFYTLPPLENIDTGNSQRTTSRSPGRPFRTRPHSNSVSAVESTTSSSPFHVGMKRTRDVASRPDMLFLPFETTRPFRNPSSSSSTSVAQPLKSSSGQGASLSQPRPATSIEQPQSSAEAADAGFADQLRYGCRSSSSKSNFWLWVGLNLVATPPPSQVPSAEAYFWGILFFLIGLTLPLSESKKRNTKILLLLRGGGQAHTTCLPTRLTSCLQTSIQTSRASDLLHLLVLCLMAP